jgi:hypothetical protein
MCLSPLTDPLAPFRRSCHSNPAIEKWAKYKEDYHLRFRFTARRTLDIAFWGFAVPIALYFVVKNEQVCSSAAPLPSQDFPRNRHATEIKACCRPPHAPIAQERVEKQSGRPNRKFL